MMRTILAMQILCLCGVVSAQSSSSYRLEEWTVNGGGHPRGGLGLESASYRISLDAIGETPISPVLQSATYSMDVGFALSYPPPGEVQQVAVLGDKATFVWAPEHSVGSYRVYRGELHELRADYGVCSVANVSVESAWLEEVPAVGQPFFYLVTAENTLLEEGTMGNGSAGASRGNSAPCP